MQQNQILIEGIQKGDKAVLKAFYKKNFITIKSYITQNCGNQQDAEDVFQDSMIVLYQKFKSNSFTLTASIHTYFYAICKNLWRTRLRTKKRMVITDKFYEHHDTNCEITDAMTFRDREHLYQKNFLKLSPSSQNILNLYFEGKNIKEIAKITGYSEGYVRKKKFDSKERLLMMLSKNQMYQELNTEFQKSKYTKRVAV